MSFLWSCFFLTQMNLSKHECHFILIHLFIHPSIHSFIHSFVHSLIYLFIYFHFWWGQYLQSIIFLHMYYELWCSCKDGNVWWSWFDGPWRNIAKGISMHNATCILWRPWAPDVDHIKQPGKSDWKQSWRLSSVCRHFATGCKTQRCAYIQCRLRCQITRCHWHLQTLSMVNYPW